LSRHHFKDQNAKGPPVDSFVVTLCDWWPTFHYSIIHVMTWLFVLPWREWSPELNTLVFRTWSTSAYLTLSWWNRNLSPD
jgi:hypothetical protein